MSMPSMVGLRSVAGRRATAREAWTAFWQEPGQSQCLSGAARIRRILTDHWTAFAASLPPGVRILDLGCGDGAVARALASARSDVQITGIDFARLPLAIQERSELLSETEMEALPFTDASFAAAVSQFGYEYGRTERAAAEMSRVLAPKSPFSFLVHHAASPIVAADRLRAHALDALQEARSAFCSGDSAAFAAHITTLAKRHPQDRLIAQLARVMPLRIGRPPSERIAIWNAINEALAPERCLSEALLSSCVAPGRLQDWLAPLREISEALSVSTLRAANNDPIAWTIDGIRRE